MLDEYIMRIIWRGVIHTSWKINVSKNVCWLLISGRTAKEVSPTSPRVTLLRASWFTESPRRGATRNKVSKGVNLPGKKRIHTGNQGTIGKRVHSPYIWRPVRMA